MDLINYGNLAIAGVSLLPLVLGWVEAAKKLGVKSNGSFIMAVVLGVVFTALHQAMASSLIPAAALPWIEVAVVGLGGGVAATGLYDIAKKLTA